MTAILPARRGIAWHEGWHCGSLLWSHMPPLMCSVDVWDDEPLLGRTQMDWETNDPGDPEVLRETLISIVMAPLAGADPQLRIDYWPIRPDLWADGNGRDGNMASFLADSLKLDQVGWGSIIFKAEQRFRDVRFRRLVAAIAAALERDGEVYQPELTEIAKRTLA